MLAELVKSVGLDISFDANTSWIESSNSLQKVCKENCQLFDTFSRTRTSLSCKLPNCRVFFHLSLSDCSALQIRCSHLHLQFFNVSLLPTAAADNPYNLLILATCCFLMYSSELTTQTITFCVSKLQLMQ